MWFMKACHPSGGLRAGKVKASDDDVFDVWYYHGTAEREDLIAAGVALPDDDHVAASCIVTMVNGHVIKVIEDCARLGTGILKGPVPARHRRKVMSQRDGVTVLEIEEYIAPESKVVSPWNFYPAGGCGEDIGEASGVWERDGITAKTLRGMMGGDCIDSQIALVLEEGPQAKHDVS